MRREDLINDLAERGALKRLPPPPLRGSTEMTSLEVALTWGLVGLALLALAGAWL